jgi:molybdopterin converting factor small subunit
VLLAKVIFPSNLRQYTNGTKEVTVAAGNYQDLVVELHQRFPALTRAVIEKHALAINGVMIQTPLLESFDQDSELLFVARIAGG